MKKTALLFPVLAILPLSAQSWEAGIFLGQQSYRSDGVTATTSSSSDSVAFKTDSKTVYGLRLGRTLAGFGPASLELTVGYQPQVTSTITGTYTMSSVAPVQTVAAHAGTAHAGAAAGITTSTSTDTADYKAGHYAVGAMFNFKAFAAVGVGLEYRFEKLEVTTTSTTYARPWARANIGIALPTPVLKPFIGLEAAFPLVSKSLDVNASEEDMVKSLAPKAQIGIYAGIRF